MLNPKENKQHDQAMKSPIDAATKTGYRPLTAMERNDMIDFLLGQQINEEIIMQQFFYLADETARIQKLPVFDVLHHVKLAIGEKIAID